VEQAFEKFADAKIISVLDLNAAYFQIPLTPRSRRLTAFFASFGLYEFNRLHMGISVGIQALTRVVDEIFADLKGQFVFNYLDDLVVYSCSMDEQSQLLRVVLRRLQETGFTLNPDNVVIAAKENTYLGHLFSARGISVLPERIAAIKAYPRPHNLRALRRFLGMTGFYARFIPNSSKRADILHAVKRRGPNLNGPRVNNGLLKI